MTWTLHDPYTVGMEKSEVPISLQRKLLLPFDRIKGLHEAVVRNYDESVEEELRRGMAIPYDPPEKCLEDATNYMDAGVVAMEKKQYKEALDIYMKAFFAMHILCNGRERLVLADPFFHQELESGRYEGQVGTAIRVILRVKLIARVVDAYLKLRQWEEAAYWGMRSVRIMREQMSTEFDEFLTSFVAIVDVGLIYLRTAIALKVMEDTKSPELDAYDTEVDCGQLFMVAKRYIDDDKLIDRELEGNQGNWADSVPQSVLDGYLPVPAPVASLRNRLAGDKEGYDQLE